MTFENAKVLYNQFLELGDKLHADQILKRYPELAKGPVKPEVKEDGKKSKGRAKRTGNN